MTIKSDPLAPSITAAVTAYEGAAVVATQPIPQTLAPFFQEYSLAQLDLKRDSATIIERTLRFGSRVELRWLFKNYSHEQIREWVMQWGSFGLPEPHLSFWKLFLEIERGSSHD